MEEVVRRSQAGQEAVRNVAARTRGRVPSGEAGEGLAGRHHGDTLTLHRQHDHAAHAVSVMGGTILAFAAHLELLLPQANSNHRVIDHAAFRAGGNHEAAREGVAVVCRGEASQGSGRRAHHVLRMAHLNWFLGNDL
jgi:hypothetical protein